MKLLSTLIAAVFAVVSYTAVAADTPINVQPTIAAAPAAKTEAAAPAAKDEAKPAKKAHKHHHHKKHKKHMKHENMKSDATMETPVK